MYKFLVGFVTLVAVSGCANFKVTAAMCDKIRAEHGEVPTECRAYSKEKAYKAFDKVKNEKMSSDKDIIEFHKEK